MAKNEFLRSLRGALSNIAPYLGRDGNLVDQTENLSLIAQRLDDHGIYVSPRLLTDFEPEDFAELGAEKSEFLKSQVKKFRDSREDSNEDQTQQNLMMLESMSEMICIVRDFVAEEWRRSVDELFSRIGTWSDQEDWVHKRKPITRNDRFLGDYEIDRMYLTAFDESYLFEPTSRFIPKADGLVDMYLLPTMDSIMLVRTDDEWNLHLSFEQEPLPFTKTSLEAAMQSLKKIAIA